MIFSTLTITANDFGRRTINRYKNPYTKKFNLTTLSLQSISGDVADNVSHLCRLDMTMELITYSFVLYLQHGRHDVKCKPSIAIIWLTFAAIRLCLHRVHKKSLYSYLEMITFNKILKFSEHVSNIADKVSKVLGVPRRNFWNCPQNVRKTVYTTLIRPKLEYASVAWDPHYKDIRTLEMVQRKGQW